MSIKTAIFLVVFLAGNINLQAENSQRNREKFDEIQLNDLQGLYGGQKISIKNDGHYKITIIRPSSDGLQTIKFSGKLSAGDLSRVLRTFKKVHFKTIKVTPRLGIVDESRPKIVLRQDGKIIEKSKWANDRHQRFDKIYGTLLAIIKREEDRAGNF